MQLHTFKAKQMREALALVRRELGPDAIIVDTRHVKGPGFLGGAMVQVSARGQARRAKQDPQVDSDPQLDFAAQSEVAGSKNTPMIQRGNHHKMKLALSRASRLRESPSSGSIPVAISGQPKTALRAQTGGQTHKSHLHACLRRRLLGAMLPRDICETLLGQLPQRAHREKDAEAKLRTILHTQLGDPHSLLCSGSRVAAMVGPTGVGKTTTIAKLAAQATIYENKSVTLLCLDDQRVGAVAQLQEYASILQIPIETCGSDQQIARALAKHRDSDLVLVDTPGVSLADDSGMDRLSRRLRRAGEQVTTHLCLGSSTRQQELDRILKLYLRLEPDALLATKMDEAVAIGSVVAAGIESTLPFSFITNGQKVPEDLASASSELLCDTLLGRPSL